MLCGLAPAKLRTYTEGIRRTLRSPEASASAEATLRRRCTELHRVCFTISV